MDELGPTYRWVATRASAGQAATALLIQDLRRARIFLLGGVLVLVLLVVLLAFGRTEQDRDPWAALAISVGAIGFLVVCAVGFSHLQRLRAMRSQLPAGLEMSVRFGPDCLVVRRQWAETTMQFDGFEGLEVVHGWLFLHRRGVRSSAMLPAALFPPDDLGRLRLVVAGYQPRDAGGGGDGSEPAAQ
jgi:hypothetical protein